eukprot:TRINITY_DN25845_c0_g1_i1.p1 TRINITY_DN25845_c0_g1~~TRINITY_DN25845_c0_g1_i1.p1  ORF type:complete len:430 (+),score=55.91 TRINITY_DN25845_c0_g1_i1:217-1506(+)
MQKGQLGRVKALVPSQLVACLIVVFGATHADALFGSQLRNDLRRELFKQAEEAKESYAKIELVNGSDSRGSFVVGRVNTTAEFNESLPVVVQNPQQSRAKVKTLAEEGRRFWTSAVREEWISFGLIWAVLICLSFFIQRLQLVTLRGQGIALAVWMLIAAGCAGLVVMRIGWIGASTWIDGYVMELIWGVDNFSVYLMVLNSLKVPGAQTRKALFVMSVCQMFYQMILYMDLASLFRQMLFLPYVLAVWFVYCGWELFNLQHTRDPDVSVHSSCFYKAFYCVLGSAILPEYSLGGEVLVVHEGRTRVTLLGVAIPCLLMCMCIMEIDVTLAKIEEIDSHFLNFTSSVVADFAIPELLCVAQYLFDRYFLFAKGLAVMVVVNGVLLGFQSVFQVPDSAQIAFMIIIVFLSMLLSVLLEGNRKSMAAPDRF